MRDLRVAEPRRVKNGSRPRSQARRGDSKLGGFSCRMVPQGLLRERIKLAGRDILLELAVPDLPIVRKKPLAECRELLGGKILNLAFKLLDIAHDGTSPSTRSSIARERILIERSSQRFQSSSLRLTLQPSLLRTLCRLRRFSFLAWDSDALNERLESSEGLLSILLLAPILLGLNGNHALL